MTVQIAVRLPDDLVEFLDHEIETGAASSRAAIVTRALARERRRRAAERDAAIYAALGDDEDLATFTRQAAAQPMDVD
ncbi:antitoxin [Actinobacteria bacterium YIM 96077]|uniref:Antitoxin n=1 Tax=Phytoactinopolyspora halophila TaxID=1981511 RepID=A0A329QZN5_9ACTN|nr:antitoxin [Phytoactinopolyspora halophila]AYY11794.1 antitoxin [Actinobacteria bacterium YIM 96077]RAW17771.1 antitoxin [Phytoactinopolyspora halophila]